MRCKICGRKAESDLCDFHRKAHENLRRGYEAWKKSMDLSWIKYLKKVLRNPYTGIWVKEVIQYLLSSNRRVNKAESREQLNA